MWHEVKVTSCVQCRSHGRRVVSAVVNGVRGTPYLVLARETCVTRFSSALKRVVPSVIRTVVLLPPVPVARPVVSHRYLCFLAVFIATIIVTYNLTII
jgi:hypothetical protein